MACPYLPLSLTPDGVAWPRLALASLLIRSVTWGKHEIMIVFSFLFYLSYSVLGFRHL